MDKPQAKRIVLLGVTGSAVLTSVGALRREELPPTAVGLGAAVAGIGLAALAEVWPDGAAGLAVLMLTTSALVFGGDAWAGIGLAVTRRAPTAAEPAWRPNVTAYLPGAPTR